MERCIITIMDHSLSAYAKTSSCSCDADAGLSYRAVHVVGLSSYDRVRSEPRILLLLWAEESHFGEAQSPRIVPCDRLQCMPYPQCPSSLRSLQGMTGLDFAAMGSAENLRWLKCRLVIANAPVSGIPLPW